MEMPLSSWNLYGVRVNFGEFPSKHFVNRCGFFQVLPFTEIELDQSMDSSQYSPIHFVYTSTRTHTHTSYHVIAFHWVASVSNKMHTHSNNPNQSYYTYVGPYDFTTTANNQYNWTGMTV